MTLLDNGPESGWSM